MGRIRLHTGEIIHVPTNPEALARRLPQFADMRVELQRRTGHDLRVIDTFLDGRLTQVVQHIGDVYLGHIQAHIDHIRTLRDNVTRGIEAVVRGEGRLEGVSIPELQRSFSEMDAVLHDLMSTERYVRELSEQRTRELYDGSARRREGEPDPIRSVTPTQLSPNTPPILAASLAHPSTRSELQQRARSVTYHPDGSVVVALSDSDLRLHVDGDGLVNVTVTRRNSGATVASYREFDTVPRHGSKPLSTRVMQSHHGLQDAVMLDSFRRYGYKSSDAPTIWLRNSTTGSPHRTVTDTQVGNEGARRTSPPPTYAQIRQWGIADLRAINAPDQSVRRFLAQMDKYFEESILPNIPEADRPTVVGSYRSLSGEAP